MSPDRNIRCRSEPSCSAPCVIADCNVVATFKYPFLPKSQWPHLRRQKLVHQITLKLQFPFAHNRYKIRAENPHKPAQPRIKRRRVGSMRWILIMPRHSRIHPPDDFFHPTPIALFSNRPGETFNFAFRTYSTGSPVNLASCCSTFSPVRIAQARSLEQRRHVFIGIAHFQALPPRSLSNPSANRAAAFCDTTRSPYSSATTAGKACHSPAETTASENSTPLKSRSRR